MNGTGARRPVWLEIELEAIERNLAEITRLAGPGRRVIASVKGNAYGFGAVEIARKVLERGAAAVWTGHMDEALAMRAGGIDGRILMFGGYRPEQVAELVAHDLVPTVYDAAGVDTAGAAGAGRRVGILVKVDAGLGRLGVALDEAQDFIIAASRRADVSVAGVYSHLPFGDHAGRDWALRRYEGFARLIDALRRAGVEPEITQVWGSSGVLAGLPDCCNAVCVGHLLYGISPLAPDLADAGELQPALKGLKASLIHVGHHPGGADLAIGGAYGLRNARTTGVIPFGLGDGMRRPAEGRRMEALVGGRRVPVIGTSLEHTVLDLDGVPMPQVGDEVVLVGAQGDEQIGLDAFAAALGCSPLEAMMSLSGRVPARYVNAAESIWGAFRS